jgi:hypothetical protein
MICEREGCNNELNKKNGNKKYCSLICYRYDRIINGKNHNFGKYKSQSLKYKEKIDHELSRI